MTAAANDTQLDTSHRPPLSNATVRYLTALVLMPITLAGVLLGGPVWTILIAVAALVGTLEFYSLAHGRETRRSAAVGLAVVIALLAAFHTRRYEWAGLILAVGTAASLVAASVPRSTPNRPRVLYRTLITIGGCVYVGLPFAFLIAIRALPDGIAWLLVIFAATWGTDTFAYFGGRAFGRTKLAPRLSPNKTIEGALIGLLGGWALALIFLAGADRLTPAAVVVAAIAPIIAIIGDLFESALKRAFHVKDSHLRRLNLVPGHGGVLDRVDSLLFVASLFFAFLALTGAF